MSTVLKVFKGTQHWTGKLRHCLTTISLCLVVCPMSAQTVPERLIPIASQRDSEGGPGDDRNSMTAAVLLIQKAPQKYQIHLRDLIKGDVYCDIQSVRIDKATGWIEIHFNYRGRTGVTFAPVSTGSFVGTGSYLINLPLLGNSEVKVRLTFSPNGTALGQWRNMGYEGAFNIRKK